MGKFSNRVAEINKRHKKCHSPIKQNDHLKTVKFIKLAIESYVDSVHSFIFMHMPLCIQTESGFLKKGNGSGLKVTKPSRLTYREGPPGANVGAALQVQVVF